LSRYFGINTPINTSKGIKEFKALAQNLLPETNIGDYNQAIMEFGATQCKPTSPNCSICPLNDSCVALKTNIINTLPVKKKTLKVKKRYINFLVYISVDYKTILEKREGKGIWQGLYQFPFIETESSVNYEVIKPLLPIEAKDFSLYNENDIVHKLSHQHLYAKFWIINIEKLTQKGYKISEIRTHPVPVLISNFIEAFNF